MNIHGDLEQPAMPMLALRATAVDYHNDVSLIKSYLMKLVEGVIAWIVKATRKALIVRSVNQLLGVDQMKNLVVLVIVILLDR